MNFRMIAAVLGLVLISACGNGSNGNDLTQKCSSITCNGCCKDDTTCVLPVTDSQCGSRGGACFDCASTKRVCDVARAVCTAAPTMTRDAGGGAGSDAGEGSLDAGRADSGTATVDAGSTLDAGSSVDAGPPACTGCLVNGSCASGTTAQSCGSGGSMCVACASNESCSGGVCTLPSSGAYGVGAACTQDSDCSSVPLQSPLDGGAPSYQVFCKKLTAPGASSYTGGYCTRRCLADSACGQLNSTTPNVCAYRLGTFNEVENMCLKGCTNESACRAGYSCRDVGDAAKPARGCWLATLPPAADAGTGAIGAAGKSCTDTAQCGEPPLFNCDLGSTDGQCLGNCSLALNDRWCGTNGLCLPYEANGGARGPLIVWQCGQSCSLTGTNTCRAGYTCTPFGNATGYATCQQN